MEKPLSSDQRGLREVAREPAIRALRPERANRVRETQQAQLGGNSSLKTQNRATLNPQLWHKPTYMFEELQDRRESEDDFKRKTRK